MYASCAICLIAACVLPVLAYVIIALRSIAMTLSQNSKVLTMPFLKKGLQLGQTQDWLPLILFDACLKVILCIL